MKVHMLCEICVSNSALSLSLCTSNLVPHPALVVPFGRRHTACEWRSWRSENNIGDRINEMSYVRTAVTLSPALNGGVEMG